VCSSCGPLGGCQAIGRNDGLDLDTSRKRRDRSKWKSKRLFEGSQDLSNEHAIFLDLAKTEPIPTGKKKEKKKKRKSSQAQCVRAGDFDPAKSNSFLVLAQLPCTQVGGLWFSARAVGRGGGELGGLVLCSFSPYSVADCGDL